MANALPVFWIWCHRCEECFYVNDRIRIKCVSSCTCIGSGIHPTTVCFHKRIGMLSGDSLLVECVFSERWKVREFRSQFGLSRMCRWWITNQNFFFIRRAWLPNLETKQQRKNVDGTKLIWSKLSKQPRFDSCNLVMVLFSSVNSPTNHFRKGVSMSCGDAFLYRKHIHRNQLQKHDFINRNSDKLTSAISRMCSGTWAKHRIFIKSISPGIES